MLTRIQAVAFVLSVLIIGLVAGCSEGNQSVTSQNENATINTSAVENDLSFINASGVDLVASKGIFSLEWREMMGPMNQNTIVAGRAFAVGFNGNQPQGPPFARRGIDVGSVYLNYGTNHLALQKRTEPRGGISYSSFSGPRDGGVNTNVDFVPQGAYEFEVTGSNGFSAIRTTLNTPSALLNITSPTGNQVINSSNDLTITWEGGVPDGKVLLSVMAPPPRPEGMPGPGGMGPGGHRGGGVGTGPGGPQNPMDSTRAILIRLDNNPGTYTIAASRLQQLIQQTHATRLMVNVGQMSVTEVDHDGGKIHVVLRNGDRLPVGVQ